VSLTLADRSALEALCYRYNVAADERDADAYAAVFTEDGVWDGMLGRFEGADGLRALVAKLVATEALAGTRHWANNIVIEGDSAAGTATVVLDNLIVQATPDGPRLASLSRSEATAVRVDGRWLFRYRKVTPHAAPAAAQ
jgi:uncharacterized protein (TIGR02246 family)